MFIFSGLNQLKWIKRSTIFIDQFRAFVHSDLTVINNAIDKTISFSFQEGNILDELVGLFQAKSEKMIFYI